MVQSHTCFFFYIKVFFFGFSIFLFRRQFNQTSSTNPIVSLFASSNAVSILSSPSHSLSCPIHHQLTIWLFAEYKNWESAVSPNPLCPLMSSNALL